MRKKGSITLFIITGIILVGGFFLIQYIGQGPHLERTDSFDEPTSLFVESCLEKTTHEGIVFLGLQGGAYSPQGVDLDVYTIPYFVKHGTVELALKEEFERDLTLYVNGHIQDCIKDFSELRGQGYGISFSTPKASISLDETVLVNLDFPVTLQTGMSRKKVHAFQTSTEYNFRKLYSILSELMAEHQKNPNHVPIGYLSYLAHREHFTYALAYPDNETVIYSLMFNDLFKDNSTMVFNFAATYDWQ